MVISHCINWCGELGSGVSTITMHSPCFGESELEIGV